jgi:hypothetical protein
MNYFAHSIPFLTGQCNPYFIAGLAVPDWLNVVNRKTKARSKSALAFLETSHCPAEQALARGVIQHHHDDRWFHQTRSFNELSLEFSAQIRDLLKPDNGFRPGFLGHVLVELLLDDHLIQRFPSKIERYYQTVESIDPRRVESAVSKFSTQPALRLEWFIKRFQEVKFLYDYTDNEKLLGRLNQIMQRVKLLPLPKQLLGFFDTARLTIANRADELFFEPLGRSLNT